MHRKPVSVARLALALALLGPASLAEAQFQIVSPDGKSSLKVGILGQVQGEWVDNADASHTSQNLFVRRARLILGGKLGEKVSFFLDTDSPNVGKAGADGKKSEATIYLQDLIVTYAASPTFKLDAGLLLVPTAYHSGQGATTLLGLDYSPYAFLSSAPTTSRLGRDYGLQGRGYFFGQHLEIRAGVFQGVRGVDSTRPLRTFGRVVWYPLEPQTDFFYTGTAFGKRKLLGIGVSYDHQAEYSTLGADLFLDHPVGGGNAVTAQVDYWRLDGAKFLPDLPRQEAWLAEIGLYFQAVKLGPFVQATRRDFNDPARPDEAFSQIGVAYWADGHKFNVKLGVGRFEKDNNPDRTQILAQLQLFMF